MGFGISFAIGFSSRGDAEHRHPASSGIIRTQGEPEIRKPASLFPPVDAEVKTVPGFSQDKKVFAGLQIHFRFHLEGSIGV